MKVIEEQQISVIAELKRYFWPDELNGDFLQAARVRLVTSLSLVIGILGFSSGALFFYSSAIVSLPLALWCLLGPLCVLIAPWPLLRTGNTTFGAAIIIGFLTLHLTFLTFALNGLLWPSAIYLPSVPLLATLFFGHRKALWISALVCADIAILTQVTLPGWVGVTLIIFVGGSQAATSIFHSQIDQTTKRLIQLRNEAQVASAAKSDFLANVSHEIRNPLNGVVGALQLLKDTITNKEQLELLQIGSASADSLLTILNDILDYSKIAANGIQLEHVAFEREQIVKSVVHSMSGLALEKNVTIKLFVDPNLPKIMLGDPVRLEQIVRNFTSNAIKFSEGGSIYIQMGFGDFDNEVKVSVKDEGIGMSKEACTRVFRKFEQAESSTTREFGGTGLGLSISKELAELHGGMIGVSSAPGLGSKFWFTFPLKEAPNHGTKKQTISSEQHLSFVGSRVLLAEDNRTNQMITTKFLNKLDIEPVIASDGKIAVEFCGTHQFDLILMDVQMPNKDGVEATQEIRQMTNSNKDIPIIALSGNAMKEQVDSYIKAGMTDCLAKPCGFSALSKVLNQYLLNPKSERIYEQLSAETQQ